VHERERERERERESEVFEVSWVPGRRLVTGGLPGVLWTLGLLEPDLLCPPMAGRAGPVVALSSSRFFFFWCFVVFVEAATEVVGSFYCRPVLFWGVTGMPGPGGPSLVSRSFL